MNNNQQELFTELTSSEGATVSGGARVYIHSIKALRAGADPGATNGDDVYIKVNGRKIAGTYFDVDKGESRGVYRSKSFNKYARVQLVDYDYGRFNDDNLGGFTVSRAKTNGLKTRYVGGSGSLYKVRYSVV